MALTTQQLRSINEMDVNSGASFITNRQRVSTSSNSAFLIIGAGGTGIDGMLEAKGLINMTCKLESGSDLPGNVSVLGVETNRDSAESKKSTDKTGGIKFKPGEFVDISNSAVSSIIDKNHIRQVPEYITSWLDPRLEPGDGHNGAGGKRQAGRLLLMLSIDKVIDKIRGEIKNLCADRGEVTLHVFIINGIGGGTGSGVFLDLAYIVRAAAEKEISRQFAANKTKIYNYTVLPDINMSKITANNTKTYIQRNGYAALKELDYLMGMGKRGERFVQDYGPNCRVNSAMPPFDYVHLVSKVNATGGIMKDSYAHAMEVIAENILSFVTLDEVPGQVSLDEFYSNISMMEKVSDKKFAEGNHIYTSIGAASFVLPLDRIMLYVTHLLFGKMGDMYDKSPLEEEFDEVVEKLGIEKQTMLSDLMPTEKPLLLSSYDYKDIIEEATDFDGIIKQSYVKPVKEAMIAQRVIKAGQLQQIFDNIIESCFKNVERGPVYANRLITSSGSEFDILKKLKIMKESVELEIRELKGGRERRRTARKNALTDAKRHLFVRKGAAKDRYLKAINDFYIAEAKIETLSAMLDIYTEFEQYVRGKNHAIYDVVSQILVELKSLFAKNADIITRITEDDRDGKVSLTWSTIDVPMIKDDLNDLLDAAGTSEELVRSFVETLYREIDKWVGNNVDISGFIKNFLDANLGNIIVKTLEFYIESMVRHQTGKENVDLESVICMRRDGLADKLVRDSYPSLHLNPLYDKQSVTRMLSVPNECKNILAALEKFVDKNKEYGIQLMKSSTKNRIFMSTIQCAIPLYFCDIIEVYEKMYEEAIAENAEDMYGRHLYKSKSIDWTDLPSPLVERSWSEIYKPRRIHALNERRRKLFDEALRYGCIQKTDDAYIARVTEAVDFSAYFEVDIKSEHIYEQLEKLRTFQQNGLPLADRVIDKEFRIYCSSGSDADDIREQFIQRYDLCNLVEGEIAKYAELDKAIRHLEEIMTTQKKRKQKYQRLVEYLATGVIYIKPNTTIYCVDLEEGESSYELLNVAKYSKAREYYLINELYGFIGTKKERILSVIDAKTDEILNIYASDISQAADLCKKVHEDLSMRLKRVNVAYLEGEVEKEVYDAYIIMNKKIEEMMEVFL